MTDRFEMEERRGAKGRECACFEAKAAKQENPESSRERKGWQVFGVPRVLPSCGAGAVLDSAPYAMALA